MADPMGWLCTNFESNLPSWKSNPIKLNGTFIGTDVLQGFARVAAGASGRKLVSRSK
jgi:hypothetical protein